MAWGAISRLVRHRSLRTASLLSLAGLVFLSGSIHGCSYRLLRATGGRDVTVSVVTLTNDSLEPGLELTLTRALREEFLRRVEPRLVADSRAADLVIRGRVLPLSTRANSFSTVSLVLEYRIEVTLELAVDFDGFEGSPEERSIRIDPAALSGFELYLASADSEAARKNREEALQRIADVLAGRIHDEIGLQLAARADAGEPS